MQLDPQRSRPFEAYQDVVLDMKRYWTRELFPALRQRFDDAVEGQAIQPKTVAEVDALLSEDSLTQYFNWMERHLQIMKYSGRYGLVPTYGRDRETLVAALSRPFDEHLLELADDFDLPDYYTSIDIHQHPGGVWSDQLAGAVYERGARSTTPLMNRHADLHYRFMDQVMTRAGGPVAKLLDMGCGFGKSTRAFYSDHGDLEVIGVDLAEPCLRLAALTATEDQARNVHYKQADAASTGLDERSFDVVTSTMMLHEMPPVHIRAILAEAARVLMPGGLSIHLDFLADDDPFARYIHYGHARRNNEPFMPPLNEMDLERAHTEAGLEAPEIVRFEEMPGALEASNTAWRFPWVMIVSRKPS
ncbi:MAG: class I SAM-dependent methyltransferase [Pseudomonadota bacterium]